MAIPQLTTNRSIIIGVVLGGDLVGVSTDQAAGDATAGQAVFCRCAACHSTSASVNKIRPSLGGIVGSQSGTPPGFHFSARMAGTKVTWDNASLNKFLHGSIHGTSVFFSFPNATDRQNVVV
jgi:cytochrome c